MSSRPTRAIGSTELVSDGRDTRLAIFDCDGVLVDSERIAVQVNQVVLERVGLSLAEEEIIDRFVGRSESVMDAMIEDHLGHPIPGEMRDEFDGLYRQAFEANLKPVEGISEALKQIRLPMCVASSSQPDSLRLKLGITGLIPYFGDHIFSAAQVSRGKPAPDLFLFAADRMGCSPSESVVIEDSQYGVQAALAAGMGVLAYTGGITSRETLQREGAILFDEMRALPALLRA
jgi:HAD superfamily hydrolase (TIGR01509 family)